MTNDKIYYYKILGLGCFYMFWENILWQRLLWFVSGLHVCLSTMRWQSLFLNRSGGDQCAGSSVWTSEQWDLQWRETLGSGQQHQMLSEGHCEYHQDEVAAHLHSHWIETHDLVKCICNRQSEESLLLMHFSCLLLLLFFVLFNFFYYVLDLSSVSSLLAQ